MPMVKAGKMMWNETVKANCSRARVRASNSMASGSSLAGCHPASRLCSGRREHRQDTITRPWVAALALCTCRDDTYLTPSLRRWDRRRNHRLGRFGAGIVRRARRHENLRLRGLARARLRCRRRFRRGLRLWRRGAVRVRSRKGASLGSRSQRVRCAARRGGGAILGAGAGGAGCRARTAGAGRQRSCARRRRRRRDREGRPWPGWRRRRSGPRRCRARLRGGAQAQSALRPWRPATRRTGRRRRRPARATGRRRARRSPGDTGAPVIGDDAVGGPGRIARGVDGARQPFAHAAGVAVLLALDAGHQRAHARREPAVEERAPAPRAPRPSRARRWR